MPCRSFLSVLFQFSITRGFSSFICSPVVNGALLLPPPVRHLKLPTHTMHYPNAGIVDSNLSFDLCPIFWDIYFYSTIYYLQIFKIGIHFCDNISTSLQNSRLQKTIDERVWTPKQKAAESFKNVEISHKSIPILHTYMLQVLKVLHSRPLSEVWTFQQKRNRQMMIPTEQKITF